MSEGQYRLFSDEDQDTPPDHLHPARRNKATRKGQNRQQFLEENEDIPREWLRYAWRPEKLRELQKQRQELEDQRQVAADAYWARRRQIEYFIRQREKKRAAEKRMKASTKANDATHTLRRRSGKNGREP